MKNFKITIKIGEWEQEYVAMETTAPVECDEFGTFQIEDNGRAPHPPCPDCLEWKERLVLVEVERTQRQRNQYQKEHVCKVVKRTIEPYLREMLRERVTKAGEGNLSVGKIRRKLAKYLQLSHQRMTQPRKTKGRRNRPKMPPSPHDFTENRVVYLDKEEFEELSEQVRRDLIGSFVAWMSAEELGMPARREHRGPFAPRSRGMAQTVGDDSTDRMNTEG